MAERVRQAVSSWRHTDSTQVSANPADAESVTVRYVAMLPLLCLHWDQVTGAWQGRAGPAAWRLRLCRKPLPSGYLVGVLATVTSLVAVPYAEELSRCARARRR